MKAQSWRFEALDTWFFKESRPLEAVGGAQLGSMFPPPARTLIGAVRTILGDAQQVQWSDYAEQVQHPLRALIGSAEELGPLSFQGPYLLYKGQRLYPAPLLLLHSEIDKTLIFTRLHPAAQPTQCDLGWVRLPQKDKNAAPGAKPVEGMWLTAAGLQAVLKGGVPKNTDLHKSKTLFETEERLGIALEQHSRRPLDGLLYQTKHIRPNSDTALGLDVYGLDTPVWQHLPQQGLVRLGGEGRPAAWSRSKAAPLERVEVNSKQLMLCLLTHAHFAQGWVPDGFVAETSTTNNKRQTLWRGQLAGKNARLVSVVTGKPVREGGWDLAGKKPRTLHSLVPAGSCYFFELDSPQDAKQVAQALHGGQWGRDSGWGRGQVAVGQW